MSMRLGRSKEGSSVALLNERSPPCVRAFFVGWLLRQRAHRIAYAGAYRRRSLKGKL